ncbi:MAG: hypothetical protein GY788_18600 [bacterium]|nr:hypothetical protein [bacterium]
MEPISFGIVGVAWAVWIVGTIRLFRCGRTWTGVLAIVFPGVGLLLGFYGLFAAPLPGSPIHHRDQAA